MKINERLDKVGLAITTGVGTMWCAIGFACLALISLPAAVHSGDPIIIVGWIAQTFLQLVLLAIIMVGQRLQGAKTEQTIMDTHDLAVAEMLALQGLISAHREETLAIGAKVSEVHAKVHETPAEKPVKPVKKTAAKKA